MQYVSAQATDALVLELQELERTLLADQREKLTMRNLPSDFAVKQAKVLVRRILDGIAPSWSADKRASSTARRWLLELKLRADGSHSDEGLAILSTNLVIECRLDPSRAGQVSLRSAIGGLTLFGRLS
jgi:hypothetical protein